MVEGRSIAVLLAIGLFAAPVGGQTVAPRPFLSPRTSNRPRSETGMLSSPSAAERFLSIGHELAHSTDLTGAQADQGIVLLTAAKHLDRQSPAEPLLLRLAIRRSGQDYSSQVLRWLQGSVDKTAERTIVREAIQYLLDRVGSDERRRELLETLATTIGNRNPAVDAELAWSLAALMAQQGHLEAAKFYLVQAYTNNKYNKVAFAKLAEMAPEEIGPGAYLEHLRLVVRENPLDLQASLNFAQYAERLGLYDLAARSYQYAAELFRYLYPSALLPPDIYLPWAISCYNSELYRPLCLRIAENVRNQDRFDMLIEAIAGRAAAKAGNAQEAERIFRQAEQRAQRVLLSAVQPGAPTPTQETGTAEPGVNPKQLAWFHCFADPDPAKALDWANRAYSVEPNCPSAAALLAYALSVNDQLEWARPLLTSSEPSQISEIVQARIDLSEGRKAEAVQRLSRAVARDAGSLAAERAKEVLAKLGSPYVPPVDPVALTKLMRDRFGENSARPFVTPDKMLDLQFTVRGAEFAYGQDLEGMLALVNQDVEPLVVTSDSLFQGHVRVDARVAGDIEREIPNLVSRTIRTDLIVPPGRSLVHTLRLSTGELRDILLTYPQASLDIQFTLYLDPVVDETSVVSNRVVDLEPVTLSVRRPGVEVNARYVRSRFHAISSGREGQKIQTARLFIGLLREQSAMARHGTLYAFRYADWLPGLLRSALVADSGLLLGDGPEDWVVKVHTMADMLSMPIDEELATTVARNLSHPQWPVRLMAVYLLSKAGGSNLSALMDWVANHDASELVRRLAVVVRSGSPGESTGRAPLTNRGLYGRP